MQENFNQDEVRKIIEQELTFTGGSEYLSDQWLSALSIRINDLILNDFDKLIYILYRLDINESKLMKLLNDHRDTDAGKLIGELIIERQSQKVLTRQSFSRDKTDIDEDEKW